jgi:photosystem II stability/assembly factor-like uncharacterized protein
MSGTRYDQVQQILDEAIGGETSNIGVHGAFWRGKTRDQFVALSVVGRPLLVVGDGAGSNLVKALKGEAPFGADLDDAPAGASLSRMPAGMPPVSPEHIAFIQQWIDEGCLEDPLVPPGDSTLSWLPLPNAPTASSRTDDIFFVDPLVGWAANSNGTIVHTADGGGSWTVQLQDIPSPGGDPVYFRCLAFASKQRGWAGTLTRGRTLFETKDGGQSWTQVTGLPALAPSAICGMFAVSDQVMYASGTNYPNRPARMMKTVDGGQTWTAWDMSPFADLLVDCFFTSATRGWVVGGKKALPPPPTPEEKRFLKRDEVKPVVLLTEDGGQTWVNRVADIQSQFPPGEWGWKIQFLNDQVGFVALENFKAGAILKTVDGGQTWTRLPVNDPQGNANLEGIGFVDEKHGWVGGWGAEDPDRGPFTRLSSSESRDGGATWQDANEIGKAINRFRFFGSPVSVGYAAGQTIYKYSAAPAGARAAAPAGAPPSTALLDSLEPVEAAGAVQLTITVPPGANRFAVYIWDRFGEHVRTLVDEASTP